MKKSYFALCLIATIFLTSCSSQDRYLRNRSMDKAFPVYMEEEDNASIVGTIGCGERVVLLSEGWNEWYKVEYNGSEAYIHEGDYSIEDENGEKIWMTKGLFKGLGYFIGIIILIGLALAIFALIASGIVFIFGILMKLLGYIVTGAALGWILGYAVSKDTNTTFHWIVGGVIIGTIIGIVKYIKSPSKMSDAGLNDVSKMVNDARKRKAQEAKEFPYELPDGTRVRRIGDKKGIDKNGIEHDVDF